MTFPANLDYDKIIHIVLCELGQAIDGWLNGMPKDEIALLNRITERLNRNRRGCDVGLATPMKMISELYHLHRQGPKQTDLYGSDLAVTIKTEDGKLFKTALFQFKKTSDFQCSLEQKQLNDAVADIRTMKRSFVFAVDETRHSMRIKETAALLSEFDSQQQSKTFSTDTWESLSIWLWEWFSCHIGIPSEPNSKNSIEDLLTRYKQKPGVKSIWGNEKSEFISEDDLIPARTWMIFNFR